MKIRLFTSVPRAVFWGLIAVTFVVVLAIEFALLLVDYNKSRNEFNYQVVKVAEGISNHLKDNDVVLNSFTAFRQLGEGASNNKLKDYISRILKHYPQIVSVFSVSQSSSDARMWPVYHARARHVQNEVSLVKSIDWRRFSHLYKKASSGNKTLLSKVFTLKNRTLYALVRAFDVRNKTEVLVKEFLIVVVDVDKLVRPLHTTGIASLHLALTIKEQVLHFSSNHQDKRKRLVSWGSKLLPKMDYISQFAVVSQPFEVRLSRTGRLVLPGRDLMVAVLVVLSVLAALMLHVLNLRYRSREARQKVKAHLHIMRERAEVTLDSIDDAVVVADNDGRVEYINPIVESLLDIHIDNLHGKPIDDLLKFVMIDPDYADADDGDSGRPIDSDNPRQIVREDIYIAADLDLVAICDQGGGVASFPEGILLSVAHGAPVPVSGSISPIVHDDDSVHGYVVVFRDVGEAQELTRQLQHQATHDDLTGLYNRREFEVRLQQTIDQVQQTEVSSILMFLDLDQFKIVNDTCGHIAGDLLLQKISKVLHDNIRSSDCLARIGGDEFGVLLDECSIEGAIKRAQKLNNAVKNFRFKWKQKVFDIAVSLGVVEITKDQHDLSEWMTRADSACYVAKDQGRNRYHVYNDDDDAMIQRRGEMEWLQRIKQAYEDDRFELYVQEIVPVRHGVDDSTRHFEVLLRMLGDDNKVILPMSYIMAAERYDKMYELDQWVVRTAFELADKAIKARPHEKLAFAINLSGQSLSDEGTVAYVADHLAQYSGLSKHIIFEITETAAITNFAQARTFVDKFRKKGVRFSLDDFGTGMSSFAYLKELPVDFIKIDGTFIKDLGNDKFANAVVYSINNFGHSIGVKTIAEYVESEQIRNRLFQIDVDYGQGNWLSKPKAMKKLLEPDPDLISDSLSDQEPSA